MNKNMAGILSAAAVLTMLAGCTAYDCSGQVILATVLQ